LDVTEKVDLVEKPPTEEIVTKEELIELFKTNSSPKHYIGIEISGFLHLGSLISTGFKINDFLKAGVNCTVFLADWHTVINDKLAGDWDVIKKVSKYYSDAFKLVCPGVNVVLGSELYEEKSEYWSQLIRFTKHMSLERTMRSLTIMGRSEKEARIDLAKLFYPPMQAVDIHSLELDIMHAGMDQRKIHMLVREIFPKMKWKVPVAVHHSLLPGLLKPTSTTPEKRLPVEIRKGETYEIGSGKTLELEKGIKIEPGASIKFGPNSRIKISPGSGISFGPGASISFSKGSGITFGSKMSKSDPNSTIFIHDSPQIITSKINKAWCDEGHVQNNPLLEISKQIIFHEYDAMQVERPQKFGGNIEYTDYSRLESDFANKKLHPSDLKQTVAMLLNDIISKISGKLALDNDVTELIKKNS